MGCLHSSVQTALPQVQGRIVSTRQCGIFLGRSDLARKCNNVAKYTMFRHCTYEFHLQIFDIALSAQCADVVSPCETTGRLIAARQRGKFLSRTELARQCNDVAKCTMFRHDITEFRLQMFDTTIVGAMRRRCFPAGETTGKMISSPTQTYRIAPGAYFAERSRRLSS